MIVHECVLLTRAWTQPEPQLCYHPGKWSPDPDTQILRHIPRCEQGDMPDWELPRAAQV